MDKMKTKMTKLKKMSINVSKDPAKAIAELSNPILKLIEAKTENYDDELKEM